MKRRILAFVLAFVMVITNAPISAFAGEYEDTTITTVSEEVLDLNEINESIEAGADNPSSEKSILDEIDFEEAEEQINTESEKTSELNENNDYIEDGIDTPSSEEFIQDEKNSKKSEEQINSEEAEDIVEASEDFPAFEQKKDIDGVTITVTAEEGIIPRGASIKVTKIAKASVKTDILSAIDEAKENEGIEDVSDDSVKYYYDVCLFDCDGNEIQPENGGSINITFSLNKSDSLVLGANVYHIENTNIDEDAEVDNEEAEEQILAATILDQVVDDISDEKNSESDDEPVYAITVSSDGFSYYVVEFFFSNYKYTLNGNSEVLLQDILDELNIEGDVEEAVSSAPEYFSVEKNTDDNWIVKALTAFDSEEKLTLLMTDGAEIVIVVTDSQASNIIYWSINEGLLKISTVEQSGTYSGSINQAHFDYLDPASPLDIPWYSHNAEISEVEVGGDEDIVRPLSMAFWFYELGMVTRNLSRIEFKGIDTSLVKSMHCTFQDCTIDSLDLSDFNTSNVTDMSNMFYGCYAKELDVSSFNTTSVTNMSGMFSSPLLEEVNISSLDTSNVTNMSNMFDGCVRLETINKGSKTILDIGIVPVPNSGFNPSFNGTWYANDGTEFSADEVGQGPEGIYTAVNPNKSLYWGINNRTLYIKNKTDDICINEFDGASHPWGSSNISYVVVGEEGDIVSPTNMSGWFKDIKGTSFDLTYIDTSGVKNMSYLFSGCSNVESLNLSSFDVSGVTNMSYMFNGANNLYSITFDGAVTSSVEDTSYMFNNATSLRNIYGLRIDTSNIVYMQCMYYQAGLSIDWSDESLANVIDMSKAFCGGNTRSYVKLPKSYYAPEIATQMISGDVKLIDLGGFDSSKLNSGVAVPVSAVFKLESITIGTEYRCLLPSSDDDKFPSLGGKWYSATTGALYTPAQIQSNRSGIADTYVVELPKITFIQMVVPVVCLHKTWCLQGQQN